MIPVAKWKQEARAILDDPDTHKSLRRLAWKVLKNSTTSERNELVWLCENRRTFMEHPDA